MAVKTIADIHSHHTFDTEDLCPQRLVEKNLCALLKHSPMQGSPRRFNAAVALHCRPTLPLKAYFVLENQS